MSLLIPPDRWRPSDGVILEPNARLAVFSNYNSFVIAGPGAGKTELLAQRAAFLLQTNICPDPRKILAISFKKDAATNLKERVEKRCGKELSRRFDSRTYDSFAKSLLDRFTLALPENIRPSIDYSVTFKQEESNRQNLTFNQISRLATTILQSNGYIKRALQATYSHIFLDEFQDTTNIQFNLLKAAFLDSRSAILTAVGDHKQWIMGWAGAIPDAFGIFERDFNAQKFQLGTNFRSAPRLVAMQNVLSTAISNNYVQVQARDGWNENEGECKIWNFPDDDAEAIKLATEINELILHGLKPRDICILTRQRPEQYAGKLIDFLNERYGIKARVESEFQDLLAEPSTSVIIAFFMVAFSDQSPHYWQGIMDLISMLKGYLEDISYNKLYQLQSEVSDFLVDFSNKILEINIEGNGEEQLTECIYKIFSFIGMDEFKNTYPQFSQGDYLDKQLRAVSKKLWAEYREQNDWLLSIASFIGEDSIPIMTVHKSKGLEYNTVIFLGLEDFSFMKFNDNKFEHTCTFFVAFSRAKQRVIFTFSAQRRSRTQYKTQIGTLYELLQRAGVEEETIELIN